MSYLDINDGCEYRLIIDKDRHLGFDVFGELVDIYRVCQKDATQLCCLKKTFSLNPVDESTHTNSSTKIPVSHVQKEVKELHEFLETNSLLLKVPF